MPLTASDLLLILILGLGSARFLLPAIAAMFDLRALVAGDHRVSVVMTMLALQTLLLLFVVYLVAVRWRGVTWQELGLVPLPRIWGGRAVAIAMLSFPLMGAVSWVQQQIVREEFRNPQLTAMAPSEFSWAAYLGTLAVAGLLAPLVEEIVFRGLLYRWIRERYGFVVGVIGSALAFSLLHGIAGLIPAIALLGAILAWTYERAQSIWAPVILHGTYNAVVTTVLYAALAQGIKPPGM
ncbi:CPBP family intramembrane glutamic endopeptidase [Ferruginivarius sediminum]|uniref:CPBP family intramembrane glutamic endopeptidase n=1 Tax=Ferruginivarius sediminum TaxID=2661937 RepID=UPI00137B3505|nr:CPBP family intramembrane glutamic endopeptidase [Ferruginivarius sediminum]